MKEAPYWNKKRRNEARIAGLSHTTLTNQRGLKGSKLGPANEGRKLSDEERAAVVAEMKRKGQL